MATIVPPCCRLLLVSPIIPRMTTQTRDIIASAKKISKKLSRVNGTVIKLNTREPTANPFDWFALELII